MAHSQSPLPPAAMQRAREEEGGWGMEVRLSETLRHKPKRRVAGMTSPITPVSKAQNSTSRIAAPGRRQQRPSATSHRLMRHAMERRAEV